MRASTVFIALASSVAVDLVSAHGFVRGVRTTNGQWTPGSDPVWYYYAADQKPVTAGWDALNQDLGFVEPAAFGSSDINCHKSAVSSKAYASVNAGDTLTFYWSGWADSHKGPIINYIAPCNGDCTTQSSSNLRWSKISQSAIVNAGTQTWVTDNMLTNNYTSSTVIPRRLKPGNYVIRHEIIALHGASSDNGAQMYPQCINLKVGGSGTVAPTGGVAGTALYKRDEAGIRFNLYTPYTTYPYPGPAVWTGAN